MKKILKRLAIVVAALMLVFSTICSFAFINSYMDSSGIFGFHPHFFNREDNVTVGDQYKIRATKEMTDAYKSGDTSALSDEDKETLEMAKKVMDDVINDGMSNVEKERAIFDWMCANLRIDDGTLTLVNENDQIVDNPHGVLKSKKAVCVGFATTFRMFMEMMDIPCRIVHDDSKSHSWDLVQIDDNWYHVDIYSAISGYNDFYFNAPDTIIRGGDTDWDTRYFESAESIEHYAPFENNKAKVKDILAIPGEVRKLVDGGNKTKNIVLEFEKAPDEEAMNIADMMVDSISNAVVASDTKYLSYYWYNQDDKNYYIISYVYLNDEAETENDGEDVGDIPDDLTGAANKALREAFGDMDSNISIY